MWIYLIMVDVLALLNKSNNRLEVINYWKITMKKQFSVGIDIGSTKIVTIVSNLQEGIVDIVGIGLAPTSGVRKGVVTDIEETVSSISASLEEAERMSGIPITEANISVNGVQISSDISHGIIAVSRADGEIAESDVERVVEAARSVNIPPNREIIHSIPRTFSVDGQTGISDPIGMSGIRLEVDTIVISSAANPLKNLLKCLNQAGIAPQELVFVPLAAAKIAVSKRQKEIGVVLIDIGSSNTNFVVFEEGDIMHTGVIPIGASYVTNDIAIGLRTNIDVAERIKIEQGLALAELAPEDKEMNLKSFGADGDEKASIKYVSEIIEARMNEIFLMIRDELRKINRDAMLPAGAVLVGGGAKQKGIIELAKETLHLPAQIGKPTKEMTGMVDNIDDPGYAAGIGLSLWSLEAKNDRRGIGNASRKVGNIIDRAKGIFKNFVP